MAKRTILSLFGFVCVLICLGACAPEELIMYDSPFPGNPCDGDSSAASGFNPPSGTLTAPTLAFAGADFENIVVPGTTESGAVAAWFAYDTPGNTSFGDHCLKLSGTMSANGSAYSVPLGRPGTKTKITMWVRGTASSGANGMFLNFNSANGGTYAVDSYGGNANTIWKLSPEAGGYDEWSSNTYYNGVVSFSAWEKISLDMSTQSFYRHAGTGLNGTNPAIPFKFRAGSGVALDFYIDNVIYED
ncbi:MAG: hypothetical protein LBC99_11035 [Spirochaetota bacterium]|jgi:hypothetical protein|nr:hypothetical protein [Spirochaetota bacterium]